MSQADTFLPGFEPPRPQDYAAAAASAATDHSAYMDAFKHFRAALDHAMRSQGGPVKVKIENPADFGPGVVFAIRVYTEEPAPCP
jgi:hypothetical protein